MSQSIGKFIYEMVRSLTDSQHNTFDEKKEKI